MADGFKRLVINTLERAVSTDINRLQRFAHKDTAEIFRRLLDVTGNFDLDAGGVVVEPNSIETPLRMEILAGLLVRPQPGTVNLRVDPGAAFVMAPDAAADESNYKYIDDAGVTVDGVLAIGANASGSTRIDVVECQINSVENIVSANRDIYDPTTGLFTVSSVTKERTGRLTYRVRAGTAGAGFPGVVAGWTPLCVASVPTGTTNIDTVTFWDVRPLLNDRVFNVANVSTDRDTDVLDLSISTVSYAAAQTDISLQGYIRANYNGRRVGGRLRRGTPGTDADTLVVGSTILDNVMPGASFNTGQLWYLMLCFPFGLPRWARYTGAPAGARVPRAPLGIPVVIDASNPPTPNGRPTVGVPLPTSTGLGGSTIYATCVLVGCGEAANKPGPVHAVGRRITWPLSNTQISPASSDANKARYTVSPGYYAPNARSLLVEADAAFAAPGANWQHYNSLIAYVPGSTTVNFSADFLGPFQGLNGVNGGAQKTSWIGVPQVYPSLSAPTFTVDHSYLLTGGATASGQLLIVRGVEI